MLGFSPLTAAGIAWAAVTAILAVLLIYRSLIAMKEDDQLFLDSAQAALEHEQQQVQARLRRLAPYTKTLGALSGALLVAIAGLWLYAGFTRPMMP